MTMETDIPKWIVIELSCGLLLYAIGLVTDDVYMFVTGISFVIMATVCLTGERVIHKLSPKRL